MPSKLNFFLLKRFLYSFLIILLIMAVLLFIGDFVEQLRKSSGNEISLKIIFQLALLNFPNLIIFTLPLITFFGSLFALLNLTRNSEKIIIGSVGISNLKLTLPGVFLYLFIAILFIAIANPLISILDKKYSEMEYKYIDRVDKFASITKNGLWLKQDNISKNISSVLYAKNIKNQGKKLLDFMILEYDSNGSFIGRLDGETALLKNGYWEMKEVQITPKYGNANFKNELIYETNINPEDITDSLSSPKSISIWRLAKFINFLEELGYSAIDFKMHYYDLIFLPLFMCSLVFLASSLTSKLKQNDKYAKTIIISLIMIFVIYFLSNLFNALGSTSQLKPIIAKCLLPSLILILSVLIFNYDKMKKTFLL